jgi:hypothetical protein
VTAGQTPVSAGLVPEESLEGWTPEPSAELPLARIIDLAFDYRGNTTVIKRDGTEVPGYLFNRDADAPAPFIQLFDTAGAGPFTIPYAEIRTIRFTGKDPAAGAAYTAWLSRKKPSEPAEAPAPGGPPAGTD